MFLKSLIAFGGFCFLVSTTQSQTLDEENTDTKQGGFVEEIVTIGTKRTDRSADDLAVPVNVISPEELTAQSSNDILDILANVIPSYNANREAISDAATLVRPVSLRGLPADSTLVLLNNKRRHKSAVVAEFTTPVNRGAQGVDILPLAGIALKQVEVLRDGAAAQYGSDAIAGVINFKLEDDPTARKLRVQAGSYYAGDGDNITISGLFGASLRQDGFITFAFEGSYASPTSRGSQDPGAAALIKAGNTDVPDPVIIWGSPKVEDTVKLLFNAGLPTAFGELYSFGNWSTRAIDGSFYYRNPNARRGVFVETPPSPAPMQPATAPTKLLVVDLTPADSNACPDVSLVVTDGTAIADATELADIVADDNCFVFNEMFPGGFTPRFGGTVEDRGLTVGWRGAIPGDRLTYDLSVGLGANEVFYQIRNTVNASYGPNTPTAFDIGTQIQSEFLVNLDFAIPVDLNLSSDLLIAFGFQYHDEEYEIKPGQDESWKNGKVAPTDMNQAFSVGSNGFSGFSPDNSGVFSRTSQAGYLDLEADITDSWLLGGSFRYENFSDFGGTSNFKIASRYRFNDNFSLRGSWSTGFRAPSVGQLNIRRTSTIFSEGRLTETETVGPTHPLAVLKGAKPLRPETSQNFSFGSVFNLGPVSATLDWFNIEVDSRLTQIIEKIATPEEIAAADDLGFGTVSSVAFFVNGFDSRTGGVEAAANYPFDWAAGSSTVTASYSWTDTKVTPGSILSEADAIAIENGLPQHRLTLSFLHTQGSWSGLVRLNYYGKITEQLFGDPGFIIVTSDVTVVDLEITYAPLLNSHYNISFGVSNLFDDRPDNHRFANMPGIGGLDFPASHPAGFNGGSYYLRLALDL